MNLLNCMLTDTKQQLRWGLAEEDIPLVDDQTYSEWHWISGDIFEDVIIESDEARALTEFAAVSSWWYDQNPNFQKDLVDPPSLYKRVLLDQRYSHGEYVDCGYYEMYFIRLCLYSREDEVAFKLKFCGAGGEA